MRWRRQLEGPVTPGPVVAHDGTIYVASNAGVLHALDPATGADRWRVDAQTSASGSDLSTSALVLPDDTILWGPPGSSNLLGISPTGAKLWTVALPGRPTSPTTVDGRRIYAGDGGGGVTALDVSSKTGEAPRRAWTTSVGSTSYGSVVADGSGRLYTTADSALVALDDRGTSVREAWRANPDDHRRGLRRAGPGRHGAAGNQREQGVGLPPRRHAADGLAYVADHSGRVRVLRVSDGDSAAAYQVGPAAQIWSGVAVDRGHRAYFATQDGRLFGLAPEGRVLFAVTLGGPVDSYPALTADGAVVIGDRSGQVIAVD